MKLLKFLGVNTGMAGSKLNENILSFYYDSDAFISKGMVTILCDIYGDRKSC